MSELNENLGEGMALVEAYHAALERGDPGIMLAAGMRFMAFACEQAEREPSTGLRLRLEAHEHEETGDWQKAEAAYRKALAWAQGENNARMIFKAHHDLAGFYSLLSQKRRASEEAASATEAARRSDLAPLVTTVLESQARCWLNLGEWAAALAAVNEILSTLPDNKLSETRRARAWVLRARCQVELRAAAAARDDLDRAWHLLASMAGLAMFAGMQSGLAGWWEVTASLRFLDADREGAADAWRKAVEYRRHISQLPQLGGPYKFASLANTLCKLERALLAVEDAAGAEEAFGESREIRQRIGLS